MNQMLHNVNFANGLAGWAKLPDEAVEILDVWGEASTFTADDPTISLHHDARNGLLKPGSVHQRFTTDGAIISANSASRSLANVVDGPLSTRFIEIITANADGIVEQLRDQFDKAVALLADSSPHVRPEATAEELLSAGPAATQAWQNLGVAETTLDMIRGFREQLTVSYNYPSSSPGVVNFVAAVDSPGRLHLADLTWRGWRPIGDPKNGMNERLAEARGGRWRHMIEAGFDLRLNLAHEAHAIAATMTPSDLGPVAA